MTFRACGFGLLAAAAIAAVSLGAGAAQASVNESVTIISPGSYSQSSSHAGLVTNAPTHPTSSCAGGGGGLGGPGPIGGGTGCGTVVTSQVTLKPAPSLMSYTSSATDATDATANLTYSVQVVNIGTATIVPLHLLGNIELSSSHSGARGEATVETTGVYGFVPTSCSSACVLSPDDPRIITQHYGCGTTEYDCDPIHFVLDFYVGPGLLIGTGVGQVSLTTEARVFEGSGLIPISARAFIDPIVTIDQSFLDLHPDARVILSDGVGNGETSGGVPEPTTWALMIAGFGLAGASLRRRRAALA